MEGSPLNTDLTTPRLQMVDRYINVSKTPGLGMSLTREVVQRYRVG